jgi:hypothetical protein
MLRIIILAALLLTFCAPAFGQDVAAFTQLLKSEKAATELVADLKAYDANAPWDSETIWSVAQKLAVKGVAGKDIGRTIIGSGEVAAALDGNNRLFAAIALTMGGIYKEKRPGPSLYALEGLGVPVFDLLGEILERSPREVRNFAEQDRLRSEPIAALLAESCRRRYQGMSERLLLKIQAHP